MMPAFAALILSPPAWVTVALLACSLAAGVGLGARRIARARAAQATAARDGVALVELWRIATAAFYVAATLALGVAAAAAGVAIASS